jgi:ligand-binding SRPBCC domain-containing protein
MHFDPRKHRRKSRPSTVYRQSWSVHIDRPVEDVFDFCLDGRNFLRIAPNRVEPVPETDEFMVQLGHVYPFRQWTAGVGMRWTMHIVELEPNERFVDELLRGPMRYVRHTHQVEREGRGTRYTDVLEYRPYGGALANALFVKNEVDRTFQYRQREMKRLLESGDVSPNSDR